MDRPPCPLPVVYEALWPFIHTREETEQIRFLLDQILPLRTVSSPTLHGYERISREARDATVKYLTGTRKAYWKAVQAHDAAQERLDALRTDLAKLQRSRSEHVGYSNIASIGLTIIEGAIRHLCHNDSKPASVQLPEYLEAASRAPHLPLSGDGVVHNDSLYVESIMGLKKAVLQAGHESKLLASPASRRQSESQHASREQASRLHVLQQARDELVGWIEGELNKIPEPQAGGEDMRDGLIDSSHGLVPMNRDEFDTEIEQAYKRYVALRIGLIQTIGLSDTQSTQPQDPATVSVEGIWANPPADPPVLRAISVFPYMTRLSQFQQDEKAILQESAYLRRRLTAISGETRDSISRLADESHLVAPSTIDARAWAEAARDANETTRHFVESRLQQAEKHMESAIGTITDLGNMPSRVWAL
ncbi:hypothetical protein LTR50_004286 [Elasticomyces elasticus]|nr:hypothetical protein LTR50_004286 [Elasticomyces elasticus]